MKLVYSPGRDDLLAQLQGSRDFLAHIEAAEGLGRYVGDAAVRAALGAALRRGGFFAAKRSLAMALAQLGGDASRDLLIAALGERDPRSRRGIVRALGEFRADATAAAALRQTWKREKSYFVRAEILTSLSRIRAAGTAEFLVAALRVASFRDVVRAAALRGLGELDDERGLDAVRPWMRHGHERWTRDAAMRTAALLGRAFPSRGRAVQEELEMALREPSYFAVQSAIDALAKLGRPQAVPALRAAQLSDIDARLQKSAREAIATLTASGTPSDQQRALRVQVESLQSESRDLRARLERLEARLATSVAAPAAARRRAQKRRAGARTKRSG
jgi:aminopeptidase N